MNFPVFSIAMFPFSSPSTWNALTVTCEIWSCCSYKDMRVCPKPKHPLRHNPPPSTQQAPPTTHHPPPTKILACFPSQRMPSRQVSHEPKQSWYICTGLPRPPPNYCYAIICSLSLLPLNAIIFSLSLLPLNEGPVDSVNNSSSPQGVLVSFISPNFLQQCSSPSSPQPFSEAPHLFFSLNESLQPKSIHLRLGCP
jgi:hypothetical protein